MVRLHALPLFRDGAVAGVLRRRCAVAADDPRRLCRRLSDAPARGDFLRPCRRSLRRRTDLAAVGGADERGNAGDGPAADPGGDRGGRGLVADHPALRDGVRGRRRIYRRGRLSARRRAAGAARADHLARRGGERSRSTARGRRLGADGQRAGRRRARQLGLADPVPVRRCNRDQRVDRARLDARIARLPPPARRRHRARQSAGPHRDAP